MRVTKADMLTDTELKKLKQTDKIYKIADRDNMFISVATSGTKFFGSITESMGDAKCSQSGGTMRILLQKSPECLGSQSTALAPN